MDSARCPPLPRAGRLPRLVAFSISPASRPCALLCAAARARAREPVPEEKRGRAASRLASRPVYDVPKLGPRGRPRDLGGCARRRATEDVAGGRSWAHWAICAVRGPGIDDLGVDRMRHARGDGVHGVMLASLINHTEHDTPEQMLIIMIIVWGRDTAHEGTQGVCKQRGRYSCRKLSTHVVPPPARGGQNYEFICVRRRAHGQMSKGPSKENGALVRPF